jgi:hypothetical protein
LGNGQERGKAMERLEAGPAVGQGAAASADVAALTAAVRWHAGRLAGIRRHALSVSVRSWESPAGDNFRSYLGERCRELSRTIDLLESAARDLDEYGRLVLEAEALRRQAGP